MWVGTMPSYPMYLPGTKPNDKVLILEDTNDDGKADRSTTFADGLHLPSASNWVTAASICRRCPT